jgi:DNA modification methylase
MAASEGLSAAKVVADRYKPHALRELVPYAKNSRKHAKSQIGDLKRSLVEFGWTRPIAMANKTILAGHGVTLAAIELAEQGGCPRDWPDPWTAPVVDLSHLSEVQRRAYVIADNKLAERGSSWDETILAMELGDLASDSFDLSLVGFDEQEIAKLLGDGGTPGLTDPDATPEPPAQPIARPGDVWLLGRHRLVCGDSTDADTVAKALGGVKPHLMVTDPPYGVKYDPKWRAEAGVNKNEGKLGVVLNDDRADWREAWALFPGDVAYVWHAGLFAPVVAASLEVCGFELRSQIIWAKDRFALSRGHYHWQHEPCWYAVRKSATGHWFGDRSQATLWEIPAREDSGVGHGTQKPVACMRRPIENNSSPGQAVYEPFSGSGTTIIAAEQTGRACHAVELSPAYVDVAITRWQAFTGQLAHLDEDGRSFDDVGRERLTGSVAA